MKKKLPLDAVLRLRKAAQEREEQLLERILGEVAKTDELIERERQRIQALHEERTTGARAVSAIEIQAAYAELRVVEERRNTFLEQQQKLSTLAGQQRLKLQKVQQERETVESVIDQLVERAALVERRREQRTMDDMHGNQRTRKRIAEMSETRAAQRLDVAC